MRQAGYDRHGRPYAVGLTVEPPDAVAFLGWELATNVELKCGLLRLPAVAETYLGVGRPGTIGFRLFLEVGGATFDPRMHANAPNDAELSSIDISNHARFRAMQRLGAVTDAASKVRELLAEAEPVDVEYVSGGQAWQVGGVTIVTDRNAEVVQTLFEKEVDGE